MPLIYCTRLITKLFLLSGYPNNLIPDKSVRVSVKSLSLTCLATIFQNYPEAFLKHLDKSSNLKKKQPISDVLLFKDHTDPQLRGTVRVMIANFIKAAFIRSGGDYNGWISENCISTTEKTFNMDNLVDILVKGLEDESSNCSRQTLQGLGVCLKYILESQRCLSSIPILNALSFVTKNPYWLVKVCITHQFLNYF